MKKYYKTIIAVILLLVISLSVYSFLNMKVGFIDLCKLSNRHPVYLDTPDGTKIDYEYDVNFSGKLENWYYLVGRQSFSVLRDEIRLDLDKFLFLEPTYHSFPKANVKFQLKANNFIIWTDNGAKFELSINDNCRKLLKETLLRFDYRD